MNVDGRPKINSMTRNKLLGILPGRRRRLCMQVKMHHLFALDGAGRILIFVVDCDNGLSNRLHLRTGH